MPLSFFEKLKACFREALALPPEAEVESLAYQQHPSWDSVAHMRLVAGIETAFDIMMETDQILAMSSFSKAQEILQSHGVATDA